ncbi:MAG: hypothetical protein ACREOH_10410 [Candidatus Entotheonellia bacterium]
MAHPLEEGLARRQITAALTAEQWQVVEGIMRGMEEIDPGGSAVRYGYLLMCGLLRFRVHTRASGSAIKAWRLFLEEQLQWGKDDERASGLR